MWSGYDVRLGAGVFYQVTSDDGGATFSRPRVIQVVGGIGQLYPVTGRSTIDGVAGSRTDVFPSIDIANGAPTGFVAPGVAAPNTVALTWSDDSAGTNNERAYISYSADRGGSYSENSGFRHRGRPGQPAGGGHRVGRQHGVRDLQRLARAVAGDDRGPPADGGVVLSGDTGGALTEVNRGVSGDARGSNANSLSAEFLGDYNYGVASPTYGATVWNDVRNAADCPAVDAYRQSLADGTKIAKPSPCQNPTTFGNTDICSYTSAP